MKVEWISEPARFEALGSGWDALLPDDPHPFDLHDWFEAWWMAFGGEADLALCTIWDGGELAGVLPLQVEGQRVKGLANGHSGMFRPLARDEEAMEALLAAAFSRQAREIDLQMLPATDPTVPRLEAAARQASMRPFAEAGFVSPLIDTSGDPEAWRKESHSSWKKRLARYRRKMERDHDATLEIVAVPDRLDAWLEEGFRIEQSGWKGEGGTAILSAPETELFYREIARRFHDRGELRLSRIALDGEAVAFSFCIQAGGSLYSLKAGYDERWGKLVPGLVLQLSIIERCFELGLDAYELLGEMSDWKEKVATGSRRHTNLRVFPPGPSGALRYGYRAHLRPPLKRALHRLRSRGR
ncbi:MAG TPA: GNAT family N-acetyltransferase [Solirubrobacterales bacterium]|nr:GNAT family N-acetyltransferase [Solirubrobacterales bacterium]